MTDFRRYLTIKWLGLLLVPVAMLIAVLVVVLVLLSSGGEDGLTEDGLTTISPPGWEGGPTSGASGDGDGASATAPSGDGDGEPTATPRPAAAEEFLAPYDDELILKQACSLSADLREVDCFIAGQFRLEPTPEGDGVNCVVLKAGETFFGVACSPQGPVSVDAADTMFYVIPQ